MEQSSSYDELTVMHQFDRKCKLALEGERIDYERHIMYRRKHEILFSEMSEKESCSLSVMDEYELEKYCFQTCGYDVEVKDVFFGRSVENTDRKKKRCHFTVILHGNERCRYCKASSACAKHRT